MSFTHPQSLQLQTAIFIPGVLFALFQQSQKLYHALKISILLRRVARLKPDSFSKSKPEPGSNPTRKARAQLTTLDGTFVCIQWNDSYLIVAAGNYVDFFLLKKLKEWREKDVQSRHDRGRCM